MAKRKEQLSGVILKHKYKVWGDKDTFDLLDFQARQVNRIWNYLVDFNEEYRNKRGMLQASSRLAEGIKLTKHTKSKKGDTSPQPGLSKYRVVYPDHIEVIRVDRHNGEYGTQPIEITIKNGVFSEFDWMKVTTGSSQEMGLSSDTIQSICSYFATATKNKAKSISNGNIASKKIRKRFINYRGKHSRSWIPLKKASIKYDYTTNIMTFMKRRFKINADRMIEGNILSGEFVKEADGWYVCFSVEEKDYGTYPKHGDLSIGVDLGLKNMVVTSTGQKLDMVERCRPSVFGHTTEISKLRAKLDRMRNQILTKHGVDIAKQNSRKKLFYYEESSKYRFLKKKIKQLEQQQKECRKLDHHQIAHILCDNASTIYCGNLSGKFIQSMGGQKSKTNSMGLFKTVLEFVAKKRGVSVFFVNEAYSTTQCSSCGCNTGPTGTEGLGVREWECSRCHSIHDRDINAAKNILRIGQNTFNK